MARNTKNDAVLQRRLSTQRIRYVVVVVKLADRKFDAATISVRLAFTKPRSPSESIAANLL